MALSSFNYLLVHGVEWMIEFYLFNSHLCYEFYKQCYIRY